MRAHFFVFLLSLLVLPSAAWAADADEDGIQDDLDFCTADAEAPRPHGCDTDRDGYGNHCDADLDNDGDVDADDKAAFDAAFRSSGAPGASAAALNCDGSLDLMDFSVFGPLHGKPVGPSGLHCAGEADCR